jgi:hypothetical protein
MTEEEEIATMAVVAVVAEEAFKGKSYSSFVISTSVPIMQID